MSVWLSNQKFGAVPCEKGLKTKQQFDAQRSACPSRPAFAAAAWLSSAEKQRLQFRNGSLQCSEHGS